MVKDNKTVLEIFTEGCGIYLRHLVTFLKYMSFPVFGQMVGLIVSLSLPLWFVGNFGAVIQEPSLTFALTLGLTIPGLILFTKAFWEYLVAYVSINSMTENTVKSGRIYDINAHKKVATMSKRVGDFVALWLLFGLFTIIAILPPMWAFAGIIFVFISLIFQVFTFEKTLTPAECFVRSKDLVFGHFWKTVGVMSLVGCTSYVLLPKLAEILLNFISIPNLINMVLDPIIIDTLPLDNYNAAFQALNLPYVLTSLEITKMIVSTAISTLVICFTLPLRSICFTLWYKQLCIQEIKAKSKKKKAKKENV